MTGVNQTILMCLSMVVVISLIGGGLGKAILEALQYAAKGSGLLGGLAILFCAMVIDRVVQGALAGILDAVHDPRRRFGNVSYSVNFERADPDRPRKSTSPNISASAAKTVEPSTICWGEPPA